MEGRISIWFLTVPTRLQAKNIILIKGDFASALMAGLTLSEKIISRHRVAGKLVPGEEITVRLDQALLQDATGTMAWQGFEQMGVRRVKPSLCVQYIDHNLLQEDNKNMDDHLFLTTVSS